MHAPSLSSQGVLSTQGHYPGRTPGHSLHNHHYPPYLDGHTTVFLHTDAFMVSLHGRQLAGGNTSGYSFQEAGTTIVSSCRAYLSDTISLKWIKV